ncbi:glutamine amidotransferase subunit hisH [Alcanivorax sp. MD8A]|uniref:imidazole glycerol phosphate synthase subunit HisH n=1 Tax=Alcanivorax sp. MD8A TaxID=1177157 RepID=UPI000C9B23DB|nr:imidazole glycerol phosphate synthase subunit HisH [Alcanivorax sp. MD8A]MEE2871129.1 imidazole glycerol phosphate synthase subunit HisH [Pseudomonadota bacterium]PNE01379.1 glutamine amidotransferase subunit hisH [Alcanivorax sp. MD8A]
MTEVVAVIDYGMGNLHSASKALEKVASGQTILITSDPDQVRAADRVVFPGVGAIRDCIAVLRDTGLDQAIHDVVAAGKPLLGICVGMQALLARSEENNGIDCLGVFSGQVSFFGEMLGETGNKLKVPHMGWNQVQQGMAHPMWAGIADNARFYFVHSYCATDVPESEVAGYCDYGRRFAAAVTRDNVFAVQFHPEKSADAGLTLLENFLRWQP